MAHAMKQNGEYRRKFPDSIYFPPTNINCD